MTEKTVTKRTTVAAALSADEFATVEELCIDLRIRRNSDFVKLAIHELLAKHGRVVADAATDSE